MQQVHYATTTFAVSDALANELLAYTQDLIHLHRSDTITFPALTLDGDATRVTLLLSPISSLAITGTGPPDNSTADDTSAVTDLQQRRAHLANGPTAEPDTEPATTVDDFLWFDLPD